MPFVLIIFGEMLLISGIQGTQTGFFNLLKGDFTGTNSFIYWLAAIAVIGGLGYVPKLKPVSNAFLVLILVVLVINQHTNLFSNFTSALQSTSVASVTPVASATQAAATTAPSTTPQTSQATSNNNTAALATDFIGQALKLAGNT